jgi:hypothetical protein
MNMPKIIALCLLKDECPFKRTYKKGRRKIPTCGFKEKCSQNRNQSYKRGGWFYHKHGIQYTVIEVRKCT